jgi:hypothetical protein
LNSEWVDGYLTTEVRSFGNFCVCIDSVAPVISARNFIPGSDLSGKTEIRFRINDDFSGIKSYEPVIDGEWALFEYDPKNEIITYKIDPERITKGTKHNLSLTVTDNRNNKSQFNCDFDW